MIRSLCLGVVLVASCSSQHPSSRTVNTKSGVRYWEYEIQNDIPDGRSRTYYASGQLRSDGFFLAANKHGLHRRYSPDGILLIKTFFWHDVLVWSSDSDDDDPPEELLLALESLTDPVEIRRLYGGPSVITERGSFYGLDLGPPAASFVSSDRHVADGDRIGLQVGAGGSTSRMTGALRFSLFGKVSRADWGAFFQLDGSTLSNATKYAADRVSGRQIIEAGGTYAIRSAIGRITARLSLGLPVGNDDPEGYLSTAATSFQRPSDAVLSLPGTTAIRSSVSWGYVGRYGVLQSDAGLDAAVGGAETLPVFGRIGAALGVGVHSAMAMVELSSAVQLDAPSNRLDAIGLGVAISAYGARIKSLLARSNEGHLTLTLGSEYAF